MRNQNKSLAILIASIAILFFSSCRVNHGIKVISPQLGGSLGALYPEVESLHPTFCWKGKSGKDSLDYTYDIAIYKKKVDNKILKKSHTKKVNGKPIKYYPGLSRVGQDWGKVIYLRESLKSTCHTVEENLEPNTYYTLAIQLRKGNETYGWCYMNFHRFYGVASAVIKFVPYGFITTGP